MGKIIKLPSGVEVELAPFTGKTERLIEDKKLIQSGAFTDKYLAACIASIGGEENMTPQQKEKTVLEMFTGDRNYLLVQIRIDAYGPEMVFNHQCPQCKKTSGYRVDLEEMLEDETLKVYPYMESPVRIDLPSGGHAEVRYMTGQDERKMAQMKDNLLSGGMLLRIESLNGEAPTRKMLDELSGRDLLALREAMSGMKGGLYAAIELDCLECGNSYETPLSGIPDFFIPSRTKLESSTV